MSSILVNDAVRFRVKFVDIDSGGNQIEVSPVSVLFKLYDSNNNLILSDSNLESISTSEFYYEYTFANAGTYKITFIGTLEDNRSITVNQQVYVSTPDEDYNPTIFLREDEVIAFAPDIHPLYVDPEELIPYFPDAPLLEIGEFIHIYSLEIKQIFSLLDDDDGSNLSFTALEYIKAATACELSRVYGGGGDDELSVRLGDLSITNRNLPRSTLTRANATTWCQIAATLRKEILAQKVSARAIQPKGLPTMPTVSSGRAVDPYTGSTIYLSDKDIYGPGAIITPKENPIPERGLRKHD
jgi:hypothetical protein